MTTTIHPANNASAPAEPAVGKTKAKPDSRYKALRNFAISMSIFNILGYTVLGFEQPWTWPLFALATGYLAEIVFELVAAWAPGRRTTGSGHGAWGMYTVLLPPHIPALACNMLL